MTGTIRLKADLFGRHNRRSMADREPEKEVYLAQSYLFSALGTARNWVENPAQYERVWLDHLYAYMVGYLGIPVKELKKMTFEEVFDFLDKSP